MKQIKPPLGLVPKFVRQKERLDEVRSAIARYYREEMKIPVEWVEEYNELIEYQDSLPPKPVF